jgi:heme/copper-type cytochrome/quinol oxidase subunit 4
MRLFSEPSIQITPAEHFVLPMERWLLAVVLSIGLAAVLVVVCMNRDIEWTRFLIGSFAILALVGVGGYIRARKESPRLALGLIGFALYMGFTLVSGLFIFALLPLPHPLYDERLVMIDGALGYHWRGFVVWLSDFPVIA